MSIFPIVDVWGRQTDLSAKNTHRHPIYTNICHHEWQQRANFRGRKSKDTISNKVISISHLKMVFRFACLSSFYQRALHNSILKPLQGHLEPRNVKFVNYWFFLHKIRLLPITAAETCSFGVY